jgi:hypothetical protein
MNSASAAEQDQKSSPSPSLAPDISVGTREDADRVGLAAHATATEDEDNSWGRWALIGGAAAITLVWVSFLAWLATKLVL